MTCDICGKVGARTCKVSETCGKGEHLIVIENIPMMSCHKCGVSYFTAETLHEIERIRLHHKNFAIERPVEVAQFA